jgi:hypothetical protein
VIRRYGSESLRADGNEQVPCGTSALKLGLFSLGVNLERCLCRHAHPFRSGQCAALLEYFDFGASLTGLSLFPVDPEICMEGFELKKRLRCALFL